MSDDTYNGWTNRETWCAALWLSNDEYSDANAREACRGLDEHDAAHALESLVEELNPLASDASMFSDLLGAALRCVDWREIARGYLSELEEEEESEEEESEELEEEEPNE